MHDPIRQADFLRQTLAHAKRPFALFIGAGCAASLRSPEDASKPLIPDIAGITAIVSAALDGSASSGTFATLRSGIHADGLPSPSVEDYLTQIRSLRQVAGSQTVRGLNRSELEDLDTRISEAIVGLVNKPLPDRPTPYHSLAQWISATERPDPVELFTTNYDLLLEHALEAVRVPLFDGFVGAHRPFFDNRAIEQDILPSRWCRVWKLHGSINWQLGPNASVTRSTEVQPGLSRVIHPSHLKYDESRRMPYLALIDRLRSFLRKSSAVLVVAGYSFRDEHLNEVVAQALYSNPGLMIFSLMYGPLTSYEKARRIAEGRGNMSVLASDGAIIGRRAHPWRTADKNETVSGFAPAVESVPEGDQSRLRFALGNFAKFGTFLDSIVGVTEAETVV